ncbi:hypothetical protein D3C76_1422700 [compost metagenome]
MRRLFGLGGEIQGPVVFTTAFEHADQAQTRAGVCTLLVQVQCGGQIRRALAMLGHLEQQFVATPLQPGIAQRHSIDLQHNIAHRLASLEVLLALV